MAKGNKILHKDIIQRGNPFQIAIDGINALSEETKNYIKLLKANQAIIKNAGNSGKGIKAVTEAQKQAIENTKQITNLKKQEISLNAKLKAAYTGQADKVAQLNQQQKEQLVINRNLAKQNLAAAGSYAKLSAEMAANLRKFREMGAANKKEIAQRNKLAKTINKQNTELKRLDATTKIHNRNVGNYTGALKNMGRQMLSMAMAGGGLFVLVRLFKSSIETIREFGKQNAILAGVLGITREETDALQNEAVKLGKQYPILTSEITQLQIAYARLGFSQKEILDLTEDTITGSIALNSELEETATLVGAVVKSYDELQSSDAANIMDQLTRATTLTSLNFEKLSTALPKVMGAANAMNIPLEKTLALLGIAQDATQDASVSGTSLRNIFIELAKSGQTLDQALQDITNSQDKLTTANDKFGKRASITALALAKNIDKINEYGVEIMTAGGLTETMANEQMNTLDGAIKRVEGSWESLILSMRNSEGFLKGFMENFAIGLGNIPEYGTGGFLAGLLGIGKEQLKEAEKEVKDFYNVINNASEQGLNTWLQITGASRIKAEEEGRNFDARILTLRMVAISKRLWDVKSAQGKEAVITKAGRIKIQDIYRMSFQEIATMYAFDQKWINDEIALINAEANEKLKADKKVRASMAETTSFMEGLRQDRIDLLAKELSEEKSTEEAKREIARITADIKLDLAQNSFAVASELAKEGTVEFKILKTAETAIATYSAAQKSYDALAGIPYVGPALGAIAAAIAVAAGLANIAKINEVSFSEGTEFVTGGTPGKDSVHALLMPGERVVPTEDNKYLAGVANDDLPGLISNNFNTNKNKDELRALNMLIYHGAMTNKYLKSGLKWVDNSGAIHDVDGNKTIYIN